MARPRKDFRLGKDGKELSVELTPIPARTDEERKRLDESYELVAYFIGLATQRHSKPKKGNLRDAA